MLNKHYTIRYMIMIENGMSVFGSLEVPEERKELWSNFQEEGFSRSYGFCLLTCKKKGFEKRRKYHLKVRQAFYGYYRTKILEWETRNENPFR